MGKILPTYQEEFCPSKKIKVPKKGSLHPKKIFQYNPHQHVAIPKAQPPAERPMPVPAGMRQDLLPHSEIMIQS
eukprot:5426191-Karenia_brevis.AAC.1